MKHMHYEEILKMGTEATYYDSHELTVKSLNACETFMP